VTLHQRKLLLQSLLFFSASSLALEIYLMRFFSAFLWGSLGSMIIAIAMLGFGVSAPILASIPDKLRMKALRLSGGLLCFFTLISVPLLKIIPFNPYLLPISPNSWFSLFSIYTLLFIPFLSIGVFTGLLFRIFSNETGKIYAHSLLGAGSGAILMYGALSLLLPEHLIGVVVFLVLCGWLLFCTTLKTKSHRIVFFGLAALPTFIHFFIPLGTLYDQYKDISTVQAFPDARRTFKMPSHWGTFEIIETQAFHSFPGLMDHNQTQLPKQHPVFLDGNLTTFFTEPKHLPEFPTSTSLIFSLKPKGSLLIVGAGGGWETQYAHQFQFNPIVALEPIEPLLQVLKTLYFGKIGGPLLKNNVQWESQPIRPFLNKEQSTFDMILITSQTQNHPLTNTIHTQETYTEAFDRTSPEGILVIETPLHLPPKNGLRVIATLMQTLKKLSHPSKHILAFRDYKQMSIIIKKKPWTQQEAHTWKTAFKDKNWDVVYPQNANLLKEDQFHKLPQPYYFLAFQSHFNHSPQILSALTPFDIRPTSDNRPYFDRFIRWTKLKNLFSIHGRNALAYVPLSDFMRGILLIQLILGGALLILLPAFFLRRKQPKAPQSPRTLLYFCCLGLGYIGIEMFLIDALSPKVFGDPVSSAACVLSSLLICSGVGAYLTERIFQKIQLQTFTKMVCFGTALFALITGVLFLIFSNTLIMLPQWSKFFVVFLMLSPLGMVMGMPFPLGLKQVLTSPTQTWSWAYGVNGYFSVLGAPLAILFAEWVGLNATLFVLAGIYCFAAIIWKRDLKDTAEGI